jgi:acid stress chaperone HdeB
MVATGRGIDMRNLVVLIASFMLAATAPVVAQKVDVSTITCKAFFEDEKSAPLIMMWLDGYYSSDDADPVVDFDAMKAKMEKLAAFCAKNPTLGLITAAEPIFSK